MAGALLRVAAVDIGTNSARMLRADVDGGVVRWVEHRVVVTGLGRGVDTARRFDPAAVERTLRVLAAYGDGVGDTEAMRAVATSATRDASDRDGFLDAAAEALGVRPEVITGEEEAMLSFAGATAGADGDPPYLVIDPGGGSTEFVYGTGRPETAVSIDIGSVRLTERLLPERPPAAAALVAAVAEVGEMFEAVDLPGRPETVIGVGGTFTSLGAIALDLPAYDGAAVHRSVLTLRRMVGLEANLGGMTVEETAAIPSLDPARAPVLLAGAVVANAAVAKSGRDRVTVSEADILDGICLAIAAGL